MFVMNMTFISSREVKKCFICAFVTHEIYIFFTSLDEISHIHSKHLNILYTFHLNCGSDIYCECILHVAY